MHRLDRVTTGILLLGKSKSAARSLTDRILANAVRKEYLAKVRGAFPTAVTCQAPLSIDHRTRASQVDEAAGKPATTAFTLICTDGDTSIVHCLPKTGRTHQIRVHLQHLGHPIVDDPLYCQHSTHKRPLDSTSGTEPVSKCVRTSDRGPETALGACAGGHPTSGDGDGEELGADSVAVPRRETNLTSAASL